MRLGPRLMLSHILLVLLCLVLLSVASVVVINRALRQVNLQRALNATNGLAESLRSTPAVGMGSPDILARLQRESQRTNGRILLLDDTGVVVADFQNTYVGERIPLAKVRVQRISAARPHTFSDGQEHYVFTVQLNAGQKERLKADILAIAVKVADVNPPWRAIVPLLGGIAIGVMVVAMLIAYAIARSVTRPVAAMTQAAESIAQGDYSRRIDAKGRDEIHQLAAAFNSMSAQVAQSQRTQRDFLANVSHDLRTPLTSIQGFSQAILEGAITDETGYRRAANIIQQESSRMQHLVDDLLELARLESGELSIDPQPISLVDMVRNEARRHNAAAAERGLSLEVNLDGGVPNVRADGVRLAQVWANLIGNAVQYAQQGTSISVRGQGVTAAEATGLPCAVRFGQAAPGTRYARIVISNQAEGLEESELERLFERFYRGDRSRARTEGTGLGLSIVRQTVLAHDGLLEASLRSRVLEIAVCLPA